MNSPGEQGDVEDNFIIFFNPSNMEPYVHILQFRGIVPVPLTRSSMT